jgi:GNAT superfamily N-acetyltransferase
MEWTRDGFEISTDRDRLDRELIWRFLRTAYWSPNVPRDVVESSIEASLCFGIYAPDGAQAGFARAVTDAATFAWIADLFVFEEHRGLGLGVWLVESILAHPDLTRVRRVMLATADAHELYRRFGFAPADPRRVMELLRPAERLYGEGLAGEV